jgi:RHS repeat-associated protein
MGWTIINEEAGADGAGTTLQRTYVGKTLAHADGTNPGLGTWRYYHMDAQGSVGLVTDPSRTVKAAFAYRPYGELYASTGSEVDDITHRYAQLEWDPAVVQYYAPYRWYHPRLSRWTTRDPLGMVDGPNVYAHVMGDPVNAVDPMGLMERPYYGPRPDYPIDHHEAPPIGWGDVFEFFYAPIMLPCAIETGLQLGALGGLRPSDMYPNVADANFFDHCMAACLIRKRCNAPGWAAVASAAIEWFQGQTGFGTYDPAHDVVPGYIGPQVPDDCSSCSDWCNNNARI